MWCIKPTFYQKFAKSEKFAQFRILHSLKVSGVMIITNLAVLGARRQDPKNSIGFIKKINTFELKKSVRRVYGRDVVGFGVILMEMPKIKKSTAALH